MSDLDVLNGFTAEVFGDLAGGLVVTVVLTLITSALSVLLAIGLAAWRLSGIPAIRRSAGAFIEVFRNVPALIQIIFWAFAVPNLVPAAARAGIFFDNPVIDGLVTITGLPVPYYAVAATIGLTLNTSAHLAEVLRAGIGAVPSERVDGARTLGADPRTVYLTVVLPTAVRTSFPAISTRLVHNMKNTALASFVAVPELFNAIQGSINKTFQATQYLTLAALLYLGLSAVMSVALDRVDRRLHRWPAATAERPASSGSAMTGRR